jgi:hypothetical protein
VLLTIMVVGFLNRATIDRTSASAYSDGDRNSLLSDYAVNIVQAQIDHASTRTNTAWASQPGMVRTFAQDGTLLQAYKLYSDAGMATNAVDLSASTNEMAGWSGSTAHFVDLNEPVEIEGRKEYPIIDPSALDKKPDGISPMIEGFEVTGAPGTTVRQPIPMPVRWLYVLEDGQTVAPSNASGTTATIPGASKSNPIVGRVAFWTDDETCKLNINTASHGMFWDIPRAYSEDERDRMARFQPALREFQRYPGHPATTSLWPALGYKVATEKEFGDFVYPLAPRVQKGGSDGGTIFAGAAPVTLDNDRLYVSTDELLFSATDGNRQAQARLDRSDIERTKFFLTARSNSPEVNLFNLPRMAIWPINAGTKTPSTLDKVIAFCATINNQKYYLQRSDANSGTADMKLDMQPDGKGRNEKLYGYINALLAKPFPGFGAKSFAEKYTDPETAQITTSIFDYIRSSNLYSGDAFTKVPSSPYTGNGPTKAKDLLFSSRLGQVTPLKIGDTKGFGRIPAISKAVFHLYVSGLRYSIPNPVPGDPPIIVREFPSTDYPMQTGKVPYYTDNLVTQASTVTSGSYDSVRRFLADTGVGNQVELLTSGIVYFDAFDPMVGYPQPRYNFQIDVSFSGSWTVNGQSLGFPSGPSTLVINRDPITSMLYNSKDNVIGSPGGAIFNASGYGGPLGPILFLRNFTYMRNNPLNAATSGVSLEYPLASNRVALGQTVTLEQEKDTNLSPIWLNPPANTIPKITLPDSTTVNFGSVSFAGGTVTATIKSKEGEIIQTYTFDFRGFSKDAPRYAVRGYLTPNTMATANPKPPVAGPYPTLAPIPSITQADMVLKQLATSADFKNRWAQKATAHQRTSSNLNLIASIIGYSADTANVCDISLIQEMDTIVSLEPANGDKRIVAARSNLTTGAFGDSDANFVPNQNYDNSGVRNAVDFRNEPVGTDRRARWVALGARPGRILDLVYGCNAMPDVPSRYPNGVKQTTDGQFWPDFDNGTLYTPDDAYINRADEGTVNIDPARLIDDSLLGVAADTIGGKFPWATSAPGVDNVETFSTPNKQMPSAGMFGSLPTGAVRNKPWQTLLFRPDPGSHPGASAPADYLLLDLFWMPVVEPYAISERFSSNGKVNMNYQILPFSYLHRSTAMCGVLQGQEAISIDNTWAYTGNPPAASGYGKSYPDDDYKIGSVGTGFSKKIIRSKLNLSKDTGTLKTFEDLFAKNEIFRSETQICSVPLVSANATWSANFENSYWDSRRLTGDNSREMPYTQLLPRLTTRSNTYTVHYRVQNLKKVPSTDPAVWNEGKDKVTSELRGSRTIERYLDPNDVRIPDYAADPAATPALTDFYRWRTLYNRTFAP